MSAVATAAAALPPEHDTPNPDVTKPENRDVAIAELVGDAKSLQTVKSFTVTWKDPETGRVYSGTFTAQRPTLGQLGQIAVLKMKLNGGEKVGTQTDFMHQMMADLQVILTDFPDWWKPHDFFTADPLHEVWEYVRRWVESFRNKRVG